MLWYFPAEEQTMLFTIFLNTAARWFARTLLVALALAALLVAALAKGAPAGILLYGPIVLTESNNIRHVDCTGATWGYFRPGRAVGFQRAIRNNTVQQWLAAKPSPRKKSSTECGTNLAEGTAIRLLVRTNARSPNHAIYIYGGTFAEFRSLLVNP